MSRGTNICIEKGYVIMYWCVKSSILILLKTSYMSTINF